MTTPRNNTIPPEFGGLTGFEDLEDNSLHERPHFDRDRRYDDVQAPKSLDDINLDHELAWHFHSTKLFLDNLDEESTPANQIAQVRNTVSAILEKIAKTKIDLYNARNYQLLEQAFIECMSEAPKEIQEKVMQRFAMITGAKA